MLVRVRAHPSIIRSPPPLRLDFSSGKYKRIYEQRFPRLAFDSFPSINRKLNFDSSGKFVLLFFSFLEMFSKFLGRESCKGLVQGELRCRRATRSIRSDGNGGRLLLGKLSGEYYSFLSKRVIFAYLWFHEIAFLLSSSSENARTVANFTVSRNASRFCSSVRLWYAPRLIRIRGLEIVNCVLDE